MVIPHSQRFCTYLVLAKISHLKIRYSWEAVILSRLPHEVICSMYARKYKVIYRAIQAFPNSPSFYRKGYKPKVLVEATHITC